jgi:rare lipoprotein A
VSIVKTMRRRVASSHCKMLPMLVRPSLSPSRLPCLSRLAAAAVALGTLASCATLLPSEDRDGRVGLASWYGSQHHGRRTASGQPFDMHRLVAAHRTLPLGSQVRVVNLDNGRSVVVRIVDRGPYVSGRVIDVSYAAAKALGILERGVVRVRLEVVDMTD